MHLFLIANIVTTSKALVLQGDAFSLQKKREIAPQTACNQAFTSCTTVELFGFVILQIKWPLCNYGTLPQLRLLLFLRLNGS